jgi:predicted DNA-binding protein (UPF0251 family)
MARHKRKRTVAAMPNVTELSTNFAGSVNHNPLTIEEYETVRLIDFVGLTQSGAAERMGVARTTVQAIYCSARRKVATLLVTGGALRIEGGDYAVADDEK